MLPDHLQSLSQRLAAEVLHPLKAAFVDKSEIIDLLGLGLVAGENVFLLGPPGTAKSALVHELAHRIQGRSFEYLLTRFTEPNELFGPFDIRRLREGELVTNTEGMLPEASLVFLDELLNANSAILNSLLMVLNERVLRRGRETVQLPTLMVVGASNHMPEDDALRALFDRFLLRVTCENVAPERLGEVLRAGWRLAGPRSQETSAFTADDVRVLQRAVTQVQLAEVERALVDLVTRLRHAGIAVSDRRAVKLQRLIAASALLAGRTAARVSDLWVCRYIWDTLEQREVLNAIVAETLRQAPADASDHPRARGADEPNPEELARDLQRVRESLTASPQAAQHAATKDQLGLLAARCQWVRNEHQRQELCRIVDELWRLVGTAS